jgi:hypothetical protein
LEETLRKNNVMSDWKSFINKNGDFELANFLYKTINNLMKQSLDMGTLLSNDQAKLRAYKEQTKKVFKQKWFEVAQALEFFGIIEQCTCYTEEKESYCEICKGSRYVSTSILSADEMSEVGVFTNAGHSVEIIEKLQKGLVEVLNGIK